MNETSNSFEFYQMPKVIFTMKRGYPEKIFEGVSRKKLSSTASDLYTLLYDRYRLSITNQEDYTDAYGVFVRYKYEDLREVMQIKNDNNISKYLNELEEFELIFRIKGFNSSRIYINTEKLLEYTELLEEYKALKLEKTPIDTFEKVTSINGKSHTSKNGKSHTSKNGKSIKSEFNKSKKIKNDTINSLVSHTVETYFDEETNQEKKYIYGFNTLGEEVYIYENGSIEIQPHSIKGTKIGTYKEEYNNFEEYKEIISEELEDRGQSAVDKVSKRLISKDFIIDLAVFIREKELEGQKIGTGYIVDLCKGGYDLSELMKYRTDRRSRNHFINKIESIIQDVNGLNEEEGRALIYNKYGIVTDREIPLLSEIEYIRTLKCD